MFREPTVFVLGAGVSMPFGFPSGVQLIEAISKAKSDDRRFIELMTIAADRSESFVEEFITSLGDSGLNSIDAWLEGNKKYMTLGKCAIAAMIWNAEHHVKNKVVPNHKNWFRWLWNRMCTPDISDLIKNNNVKFITFNYDRLLELRLLRFIQNTYVDSSIEQRSEIFKGILANIIHVHGELQVNSGEYEYIGADTWTMHLSDTGEMLDRKMMELAGRIKFFAKNIRIVSETGSDKVMMVRARSWLMDANKRVFLGFGYDQRNLDRLEVERMVEEKKIVPADGNEYNMVGYPVVGTAYRLELGEQLNAKDQFAHRIHFGENDYDAVRFCRKYVKAS